MWTHLLRNSSNYKTYTYKFTNLNFDKIHLFPDTISNSKYSSYVRYKLNPSSFLCKTEIFYVRVVIYFYFLSNARCIFLFNFFILPTAYCYYATSAEQMIAIKRNYRLEESEMKIGYIVMGSWEKYVE